MERTSSVVRFWSILTYSKYLLFSGDDFDEADFSVPQGDHPDEISLDPSVASNHFRRKSSLPNKNHAPIARPGNEPNFQRPGSPLARNETNGLMKAPQTPHNGAPNIRGPPANVSDASRYQTANIKPVQPHAPLHQGNPSTGGQQKPPDRPPQNPQPNTHNQAIDLPSTESSSISDHEPPVGFFTAKAAESLQNGSGLAIKAPAFNPHLESPSIRKTAGVDHTKTKPINREVVGAVVPSPVVPKANFVNPQADKTRRLGMPVGAASPLQNRGSYKPPQMKRPAETNGARSVLGDVTAASNNVVIAGGSDAKRQKMGLETQGNSNNEGMLNI